MAAAKKKRTYKKRAPKKITKVTPQKVALNSSKRTSLKHTIILILSGITAVVLLALLTYNPADPGLFHYDSNAVIQNKAGSAGAYLADVLFGFFGYIAYLIPVAFMVSAFLVFRSSQESHRGINLGITLFGVFLALIAGCGLATLLWPESLLSNTSGGLLGHGIAKMFVRLFGDIGATMILFSGFIAGITLFADIQWLKLVDMIGGWIVSGIDVITRSTSAIMPKESYEGGSMPVMDDDPAPVSNKMVLKRGSSELGVDNNNNGFSHQSSGSEQQRSNNNGSIIGAVTAGVAGLFAWKKASGEEGVDKPKTLQEYQEPVMDPLEDVIPYKSAAESPVLGVPDYISNTDFHVDMESFEEEDVKVAGLNDVIVAKTNPAVITPKVTSPTGEQNAKVPTKKATPKARPAKNTLPLDKAITLPPIDLLNSAPVNQGQFSKLELETHARNIIEALESFKVVGVKIDSYYPGPIITRFELLLPPGTKASKITGLSQDMARSMCVPSIRVVEVIAGKTTIGIEVPNTKRDLVAISEILDSKVFREETSPLTMVLGKTIEGNPAVADLSKMPHLLIAGTTGSGKSVGVNAMLISLLYKATPDEVRLILIDPKMLELSIYEGVPHLLTPVVTDMQDASNGLRWAVGEMERRYALMSHMKVRNIAGYNDKVKEAIAKGEPIINPTFDPTQHVDVRPEILEPLPFIVIVIDEFADMIMVVGKKVEELIARLAQKARAAGIHLILATQRPSVDVITGLIKANIPTRIAFQVSTKIDSRTILDQGGAESLLGHGDMLYLPPGTGMPQRVHGAFVADQEVEDVVNYLKLQGEPEYLTDVTDTTGSSDAIPGLEPLADSETDALYDQAVAIVTESRRASISYVQRRLKVGYNRAASMIEDMEMAGVVSAVQSNGTREVLAPEPVKD
ncbi:MAG: DNA translocase FtsK 4TM domain-containing protein [Cocleimonas sp.]